MNKSEEGKRNRNAGMRFERKVRADLEKDRWIVDKWTNNVDLIMDIEAAENMFGFKSVFKGKLHPAKSFRGITRSNGFPDFIAFKIAFSSKKLYKVIAVEVKTNGILSKTEKEKCSWYLENNIFSKILIASKDGSEIVYKEFERGLKNK